MKAIVFAYNVLGKVGLEELLKSGYEICALVTHEDDPNEKIYFESVANIAEKKGIKVYKPASPNTPEFIQLIREMKPDVLFSFYYRQMISEEILNIVNNNAYNLHGSLLPKYRGRSPLNWAVLHGETKTGVTLHKMVKKADRGEIIDQQAFDILDEDNIKTLQPKMENAGIILLKRVLPEILKGTAKSHVQDESLASYFGGRKPQDGQIHWDKSAFEIHNLVRAVTDPFPGAFTYCNGKKIIIWESKMLTHSPKESMPGEVVALNPLTIAAGKGSLIIQKGKVNEDDNLDSLAILAKCDIRVGTAFDDEP